MKVGDYAFVTTTQRSYEETLARVAELLAEQGFGIVTEIDLTAARERSLGVQPRPSVILGAYLPDYALRALASDPDVGGWLPCNITVSDKGDHRVVAAMEPKLSNRTIAHPELQIVTEEMSAMLFTALAKLD